MYRLTSKSSSQVEHILTHTPPGSPSSFRSIPTIREEYLCHHQGQRKDPSRSRSVPASDAVADGCTPARLLFFGRFL